MFFNLPVWVWFLIVAITWMPVGGLTARLANRIHIVIKEDLIVFLMGGYLFLFLILGIHLIIFSLEVISTIILIIMESARLLWRFSLRISGVK